MHEYTSFIYFGQLVLEFCQFYDNIVLTLLIFKIVVEGRRVFIMKKCSTNN